MRDLLEVLKYLHKLNISHRDIKMENILITKSGKIKLIDFGFSVKNDQLYYDFCGTPNYMSPEIISKGGYLGHKGDIWAAGILFYKLATGNFPFKGMNDKIIYRKICRGEYRV
jgi:serine/threonine protein kinase